MKVSVSGPVHLWFVVPADVADDAVPSGGNTYDRRVSENLTALGWTVHELPVTRDESTLRTALAALPDGALVLMDGLVACPAPSVVVPAAQRLRIAVVVHMPLANEHGLPPELAADLDTRERAVLHAVAAVIATSPWSARRIEQRHGLAHVHVATPGTDPAPIAPGTDGVSRLLCVANVTSGKGLDLLVDALAKVADLRWTCDVVGSLRRAPDHVEQVRALITRYGLADRVRLTGPSDDLAAEYARTDLCVLTSRTETYGMVIAESLAHGVPVLTTAVDAVPETLGRAADGVVPGLLVDTNGDTDGITDGIADGLRHWLTDPPLRRRLRAAALARRESLPEWRATARAIAGVLDRQRVLA